MPKLSFRKLNPNGSSFVLRTARMIPAGNLTYVKLCRFEVLDGDGAARSGIYHESRLYETEGTNPIAVHDLSKIKFLCPIARPPVLREMLHEPDSDQLLYFYRNPATLYGPAAAVFLPQGTNSVILQPQLAIVIKDPERFVRRELAANVILGYTMVVTIYDPQMRSQEEAIGIAPGASSDFGAATAPFLVTPEELPLAPSPDETDIILNVPLTSKKNDETYGSILLGDEGASPYASIERCSRDVTLQFGETILLGHPSVGLEAHVGDSVQYQASPFGAVTIQLLPSEFE
jgi:2-keto-4-pentenoate hydratase/2-oxohepta-3-ene-1,7-dioic acid hydratase in catechol pathway